MTYSSGITPSGAAPQTGYHPPISRGTKPGRKARADARKRTVGRRELKKLVRALITVTVSIAVYMALRTFVVDVYLTSSMSMAPTTVIGDRVVAQLFIPKFLPVHRGDVIVFRDPGGWIPPELTAAAKKPTGNLVIDTLHDTGIFRADQGDNVMKRVIGLPGDHLVGSPTGITVNGVLLTEPYLSGKNTRPTFTVTVPAGTFWVMGDNRDESADSRFQKNPYVPEGDVVGKVGAVVWPLEHVKLLP